jgi:hypothetical protein
MKALFCGLGAVLGLALAVSTLHAGNYPPYHPCPMQAPDACGPGFYRPNASGLWYGPNYWLQPGFGPFNGPAGPPQGFPGGGAFGQPDGMPGGIPAFPTHPFARAPRDYFMLEGS